MLNDVRVSNKISNSLISLGLCVSKHSPGISPEELSVKHGRIFPTSWPSPSSKPLLLLQHKPSQENNKQMSRMGTAPGESSQALRQAGIAALVPRLQGQEQAPAWLSQSLNRTRKTWKKLPLPVTFVPQQTGSTRLFARQPASQGTQTESKTTIFTLKLLVCSSCCVSCVVIEAVLGFHLW